MTRFRHKAVIYLLMLTGIVGLARARHRALHPPANNYYLAILDKVRLLEERPGPRLIFVGGSATAFGVDSAFVARATGYQPINTAVQIGLGIDFMLRLVESAVRPGDAVILSCEYHAFDGYVTTDPELLALLADTAPTLARLFSPRQLKDLFDVGWQRHAGRVMRAAFGRPGGLIDPENSPYRRDGFNGDGDFVAHHGRSSERIAPIGRFLVGKARQLEPGLELLREFRVRCERRGVRVFFAYPPYAAAAYGRDRAQLAEFDRVLRARTGLRSLNSPADSVFEPGQLFDTEYHLNEAGKRVRSERLAEQLRRALRATPDAPRFRDPGAGPPAATP